MNQHPLPWILCIMSGVFGAVMVVAFLAQFYPAVLEARKLDDAPPSEKPQRWLDLLITFSGRSSPGLGLSDYRRAWRDSSGTRFLVPIGLALCMISYLVYHFWILAL